MNKKNLERVRLLSTVVSFALSLFYYFQGDLFLSGALTGVALTGLLRFIGELYSMIDGGEASR